MNFNATFKAVLWLLLLALPAHAIAATSMAHCVRMQRVAVAAQAIATVTADTQGVEAADEGTAMLDCHGALGKQPDKADAGDATKSTKADGKCSACAACCFAVAAVDANTAPNFFIGNQAAQFQFLLSAFTFITAGLERPPKHLNT